MFYTHSLNFCLCEYVHSGLYLTDDMQFLPFGFVHCINLLIYLLVCDAEVGLPVASYEDITNRLWSSGISMEPRRFVLPGWKKEIFLMSCGLWISRLITFEEIVATVSRADAHVKSVLCVIWLSVVTECIVRLIVYFSNKLFFLCGFLSMKRTRIGALKTIETGAAN